MHFLVSEKKNSRVLQFVERSEEQKLERSQLSIESKLVSSSSFTL